MNSERMCNFPSEKTQKQRKRNSNSCHLKLRVCHLSHSEIISMKRWKHSSLQMFNFHANEEVLGKWRSTKYYV